MAFSRAKLLANTTWFPALLVATVHCQTSHAIEGFSHPYRSAQVAAFTSGVVKQWLVDEGDAVVAGQPLVKLDDHIHQALVAMAQAAVAAHGERALAESEQKLRKQRLDAIEQLAEKGHATPDELHRVESEWQVAAARVLAAQENHLMRELELEKLKSQLRLFTVVAPFTGVVTKIHRLAGEYVGPVDPAVCELAELTSLSARFLAPDESIGNLSSGDTVEVRFVASSTTVTGVATVSPYQDAETGMRSVHVKIENHEGNLAAGVRCRLLLPGHSTAGSSSPLPSPAGL
jgi:RND family efflux transporter MFP subunit